MNRCLLAAVLLLSACPAEPPAPAGKRDSGSPADAALPAIPPDAALPPDASAEAPDAGAPDATALPDAAVCPEGEACDDLDPCTASDHCTAGVCKGTPKTCTTPTGQCLQDVGTCNGATGLCEYPPRPNGITCTDNDACTAGDACDGTGVCVSGPRKICGTAPFQCRVVPGTCDPVTAQCSFAKAAPGTACDDGEKCTEPDLCDANGNCVSGPQAVCNTPPDSCHQAVGACDSAQGCVYQPRPVGSGCNDGNPCTVGETCNASLVCGNGVAVVCDTPPTLCFQAAGNCVAGTGCVYPPKSKGDACSDGDLCTSGDACDGAGACAGVRRTCTALGPCWSASCDSTDGQCKDAPLASGTSCTITNATAACNGAGACVVTTCNVGFAPLAGGCANLASGYQKNDSACLSCGASNPYTTSCTCPAGFTEQALRGLSDCAGAGTHAGTNPQLCQLGTFSATADYGGAWQQDDAVLCGGGCRSPNPATGTCSCPAGTDPVAARALVDGVNTGVDAGMNCALDIIATTIVVCVNTAAPIASFGGAYQMDDPPGTGPCRAVNPRTGDCTCPAGTSSKLRVRLLAPGSGSIEIGSNLYLCSP